MAVGLGVGVEIKGLKEMRSALRRAGPGWTGALRDVNKNIANFVANRAQGMGETKQQTVASRKTRGGYPPVQAINGKGTVRGASISLKNHPYAAGALFGGYAKQFPEWVGNTWEVGGSGGPAAINPAIRTSKDEIDTAYLDAFQRLYRAAFPDGNAVGPGDALTLVNSFGAASQQGTGAF